MLTGLTTWGCHALASGHRILGPKLWEHFGLKMAQDWGYVGVPERTPSLMMLVDYLSRLKGP